MRSRRPLNASVRQGIGRHPLQGNASGGSGQRWGGLGVNCNGIARIEVPSVRERALSLDLGSVSLSRRLWRASARLGCADVDMPACCQGQLGRRPTSESLTGQCTAMRCSRARLRWNQDRRMFGLTTRSSDRAASRAVEDGGMLQFRIKCLRSAAAMPRFVAQRER